MTTQNIGRRIFVIALAMMLALVIVPSIVFAQTDAITRTSALVNEESGNTLEGVWQTVVAFNDCQTGVPLPGSFQALRTFMLGGTLSETNPNFPSSGHGIWTRTSGRKYTIGLAFYTYDPNGVFTGTARIKEYITLRSDQNYYTSYSTFEFFNPDGKVADSGCSTETAKRFPF